jgi:hypothetical protein
MGSFDSHTVLIYFVYPMLALGSYVFFIWAGCIFLAFGEESDEIRAQSADGSQPVR